MSNFYYGYCLRVTDTNTTGFDLLRKNFNFQQTLLVYLAMSNPSRENLKIRFVVERFASSDLTLARLTILELGRSNSMPLSPTEMRNSKVSK